MSRSSLALRLKLSAAAAGFVLVAMPQPSHAAGLFYHLFGGFAAPPIQPRYEYAPSPLGVRVNPERRRRAHAPRAESKAKRQVAIDPVKNPSWYLDDPTLRKGDIVVLKGQVLVYDGGRGERSLDDFTPAQRSMLISKSERERLDRMAKGNAGATVVTGDVSNASSKGKEAALR